MKNKRGSTVEVFCNKSWRCARIVSSKGHKYTLSYDVSECWVPGDVAEVFHNLSWKMAIVLKDIGLDQFIVRLVGSLQEFEVTKSELRVRQSYQNGQWIVTRKFPSDHKEANGPELLKYGTQDNHRLMASRILFPLKPENELQPAVILKMK
ncbi:putative Agenet-like domain-containing protein [Helianthus debilis subsp. tardiflorus]